MHKRVTFRHKWLPYLLLAPQLAITLVFFIWPAAQALYQSLLVEDAFGLSTQFVWFENFEELFADELYLEAFSTTVIFSSSVAFLSMASALLLATMADRIIKGAIVYKTLLIWPYAVAPAVAGVLWFFMFNPVVGINAYVLRVLGYEWNHYLEGSDAMILVVVAASWKQVSYNFLFFLAGL